jgi:hypothetical protein
LKVKKSSKILAIIFRLKIIISNLFSKVFKRKSQRNKNSSFQWLKSKQKTIDLFQQNIEQNDKLPVSVVLTTIKRRNLFVSSFVLPAIQVNNPAEIIIIDDEELGIQEKRNKGASLAKERFIYFCDDDIIMPKNHLRILCKALESSDNSFAYTDYQAIVFDESSHALRKNYYHSAKSFDLEKLKRKNYIDTCSLVKKSDFCGFDPEIKKFQDWDLWLTLSLNGHTGIYVEETGIIKFYFDNGISSPKNLKNCRNVILKKHGLL